MGPLVLCSASVVMPSEVEASLPRSWGANHRWKRPGPRRFAIIDLCRDPSAPPVPAVQSSVGMTIFCCHSDRRPQRSAVRGTAPGEVEGSLELSFERCHRGIENPGRSRDPSVSPAAQRQASFGMTTMGSERCHREIRFADRFRDPSVSTAAARQSSVGRTTEGGRRRRRGLGSPLRWSFLGVQKSQPPAVPGWFPFRRAAFSRAGPGQYPAAKLGLRSAPGG